MDTDARMGIEHTHTTRQNDGRTQRFSIPLVQQIQRFPLLKVVTGVQTFPLLKAVRRTLAVLRLNPLLTPRGTFARWRANRAMRATARAAREKEQPRDWQKLFRLNGITWHQFYISQDLRRISLFLRELHRSLETNPNSASLLNSHAPLSAAESGTTVVQLERAYYFLLENICGMYSTLEKHVLFPWVQNGVPDNELLSRALALFSKERERIEDQADAIQSRFARLVCSTGYPYASLGPCSSSRSFSASRLRRDKRRLDAAEVNVHREEMQNKSEGSSADELARRKCSGLAVQAGYVPVVGNNGSSSLSNSGTPSINWRNVSLKDLRQLRADLNTMIEDTERLYQTERSLLYPIIAKTFSNDEQVRITNVLVYSMPNSVSRLLITIYHQAVEKHATRAQWKWYKREVPLPIRMLTPVWRARLYDGTPLGWLRSTPIKDVSRGKIMLK